MAMENGHHNVVEVGGSDLITVLDPETALVLAQVLLQTKTNSTTGKPKIGNDVPTMTVSSLVDRV